MLEHWEISFFSVKTQKNTKPLGKTVSLHCKGGKTLVYNCWTFQAGKSPYTKAN